MGNTLSDTISDVKRAVGIEVLSLDNAYEQLAINETNDRYLKYCTESEPNAIALSKVFMKPTDPETKEQATTMSNAALEKVPSTLMPSATIKIGFFEQGLPHTRPPNTIWFPEVALRSSTRKFNETFLHECIHLHQREHEDQWNRFYLEAWNFAPWTGKLPKSIEKNRRLNPDTIRVPFYIWRDEYIPVAVYSKPSDADLREVRLMFVKKDGSAASTTPPGWIEFFGTQEPSVCEHPHEMSAYFLSDNQNPFDSLAAQRLRGHFYKFNGK